MKNEINLLRRYPRAKRDITKRHETQTLERAVARQFGREYFDGTRAQGYGGYHYDGRWLPIAEDIVAHFGLKPADRVLDVGCAKGFLVKDLMTVCPGLQAFGVDISHYALSNCVREASGRVLRASCDQMPFADNSFEAVIAINTVHNLDRDNCIRALAEIERLAPGRGYVQVDSYRTPDEKREFEDWALAALTHCDPDGWRALFAEAGYTGAYYWTITE